MLLTGKELPPEVAAVVAELYAASDEPRLHKAAEKIQRAADFSLSDSAFQDSGAALVMAQPRRYSPPKPRPIPNAALVTQIDANEVAACFAPDGAISRHLDGYESRPEQQAMAAAVADAFNGSRHLVVEAGTGVGKTMAYLVPAIFWALANRIPVIISTNTKNLQSQILDKDLPRARRVFKQDFSAAVIKGRGNYACLARIERLLAQREKFISEPGMAEMVAQVCAWIFSTPSGDISELPFAPRVADKIASTSEECRGRKCPRFNSCFLQAARARALSADIVITNHSVYFSEPDSEEAIAIPAHAHVIFDEAHNLEEAATLHLERESSLYLLNSVLRKLHDRARRGDALGVLPQLKEALLKDNPAAPPEDRYKAFDAVTHAENLIDIARDAARAFYRRLADVPPPKESAFRFRREFLQSNAWREILGELHACQDALAALGDALTEAVALAQKNAADDGGAVGAAGAAGAANAASAANAALAVNAANASLAANAALAANASNASLAANAAFAPNAAPVSNELLVTLARLADNVGSIADDLEFTSSAADDDYVYWIKISQFDNAATAALHAAPIEVSQYLADAIFKTKESAILCSATMSIDGSFDYIASRIGLALADPDRILQYIAGSPFDYERQCKTVIPTFLPDLSQTAKRGSASSSSSSSSSFSASFASASASASDPDAAYAAALADFCARLATTTRGRMMILFTSYKMLSACAEAMAPALERAGIKLLLQGGGQTRERITQAFKSEGASVLMGADSFWEGVDLIGDALSCLVIARLPFDSLGDPISGARSERVSQTQGNAFANYAIPNAVIKFKQGFGRLIRHKTDRGIVVIADQRIISKSYGLSFSRNIPSPLIKCDDEQKLLAAVERFLQ